MFLQRSVLASDLMLSVAAPSRGLAITAQALHLPLHNASGLAEPCEGYAEDVGDKEQQNQSKEHRTGRDHEPFDQDQKLRHVPWTSYILENGIAAAAAVVVVGVVAVVE